jgi:hypothetical protein
MIRDYIPQVKARTHKRKRLFIYILLFIAIFALYAIDIFGPAFHKNLIFIGVFVAAILLVEQLISRK